MHAPNVLEVECQVSNVIALFARATGHMRVSMDISMKVWTKAIR
jgi:hypothetical protein